MIKKQYINLGYYLIALVWLVNGIYCKILNYVPRHEQIVAKILGAEYSSILIKLIGVGEIFIAIWVLSKFYKKTCAVFQISLILIMNILESILAPELLLWGRFNLLFAIFFTIFIYLHAFVWQSEQ